MADRRRPARISRRALAAGAVVALLGVLLGVALAGGWIGRRAARPSPPVTAQTPLPARIAPSPPPELPPVPKPAPQPIPGPASGAAPEPVGRVAIIFDDAGGSLEDLEEIIALGRPVTLAVLPGLRYTREVAERARAAGLEVFLHLPLEPEDPTKPMGPGGITVAMSDAEIAATVRADLASVPGAVGVNNHMGSKGTADPRVMRAVLAVVKERNLLFVDSVTSPHTVGASLASEVGIRTASRQVFLDNEDDPAAIQAQVRRTITLARAQGTAVVIGHAQRLTAQVLREMLGEFDGAGIVLVLASALVR